MRFNKILPFFFLFCLLLFFGCLGNPPIGNPVTEFNQKNCYKLHASYHSYEGTICAQELTRNFGAEITKLREYGQDAMADNIFAASAKNAFLSYKCNADNLGAGVVFEEAGVCNENQHCVQTEYGRTVNRAFCETNITELSALGPILDLWDNKRLGIVKTDEFCGYLEATSLNGQEDIERDDYSTWVKASYCDPREGKENTKVEVLCEKREFVENQPYSAWTFVASYSACSESEPCSAISEFKAQCSALTPDETVPSAEATACETIAGEKGITGPAAVPLVSTNYSFMDNPDLDNGKIFLDGEQFLIKLYQKLEQLEKTAKNTAYAEGQFNEGTEFTVRLRTERYTNQILQDFAALRNTQFFSVPESFNQKWYKYFEAPIIKLGFTNISAGEYTVQMVFDWAEEPYTFFTSTGEPAVKSFTITLQKTNTVSEEEKSPFLEFSLDYDLIAQNQNRTNDYGVQFVNSSGQGNPENIVLYQTLGNMATAESLAKKAYKKIWLTAEKDFSALNAAGQKGNVLAISNNGMEMAASFSRAIPVGTLIDLANENSSSYQLRIATGESAVRPDVPSFNEWTFPASNKPCSDFIPALPITVHDEKISECRTNKDGYKIEFGNGNSGKVFAQAMFFTPATGTEPAIILSRCGTTGLFATTQNSTLNSETIQLNTPTSGPAVQSIEDIFTQIKNNNICVAKTQNETKYAWNKKSFETAQEEIMNLWQLNIAACSEQSANVQGRFQQALECSIGASPEYQLFDIKSKGLQNDQLTVELRSGPNLLVAVFDESKNLLKRNNISNGHSAVYTLREPTNLQVGVMRSSRDTVFWIKAENVWECSLEVVKEPDQKPSNSPALQRVVLDFDGAENITVNRRKNLSFGPMNAAEIDPQFAGQTEQLKQFITQNIKDNYALYNVEISTSDEPMPPEPYSTVYFAALDNAVMLGLADNVDQYNAEKQQNAIIYVNAFYRYQTMGLSVKGMGRMIGNMGSHELGHLLGLFHTVQSDDIMNTNGTAWDYAGECSFGRAQLDKTVFPTGFQNAPQLLAWGVGIK
jgi:hypothetical protein